MIQTISLEEKIKEINGKPWNPVDVVRFNKQVIRIALFKGEYHWHKHVNEDEVFYVLKGKLTIQMKDRADIMLREGEVAVVPKGAEHCPKSSEDTYVLMVEPVSIQDNAG